MASKTYCGFVAIVGRANVGKSTLFNALLNEQLSIATHKPQTTRHNIRGILSLESSQLILVDTPGIQLGNKRLINKVLINNALSSLQEVDVILMVIEMGRWGEEDDYLLKQIKQANCPVVLAINKVDRIKDKSALFPIMEDAKSRHEFEDFVSANT
jgi:GTP-binding protein Era